MEYPPQSSGRQTFVTLLLAFLLGGGFFTFLVLVTGGLLFYVVPIALVFALYGFFHYLVWGRAFSQNVEGEREEEAARSAREAWPTNGYVQPRPR